MVPGIEAVESFLKLIILCLSYQFANRLDDIIWLNRRIDQRTAISCAGEGQRRRHPGGAPHCNIGFESVANHEALFRRQLQDIDDGSRHDRRWFADHHFDRM